MAEVMSSSSPYDDQSMYNGGGGGGGGRLKRSGPSRASLLVASPPPRTASEPSFEHIERLSRSMSSSASTSTRHSSSNLSQSSWLSSTPSTTFSFDSHKPDDERGIVFPSYDQVQFFHEDEPLDLPPSPKPEEFEAQSDESSQDITSTSTTDSTRSDSPLPTPTVADDTAIKHEPSRHVDYLSHDWREEDIWSSWRHIVSQRKVYGQRSRLENASWRTWAKSKYQLPTVSPETLNWLKESDVTWLYGPLQPAVSHPVSQYASGGTPSQLSKTDSFVAKKPILKKRSMSEVMLQRSLSASSLVKQAAASVQAQQSVPTRRPVLATRRSSAYATPSSRDHLDFLDLDYFSPRPSSGSETPLDGPKRHIRFDDKVEQCIAVDCKDCDFEDESEHESKNVSDSDSEDDGIVMMKRPRKKRPVRRQLTRNNSSASKTIEKLPDTTLKYKHDEPEAAEQKQVGPPPPLTRSWSSTKMSPSASQETIRPVSSSRNFLLASDDEEEDEAEAESWRSRSLASRRDSVAVHKARVLNLAPPLYEDDEDGIPCSGVREVGDDNDGLERTGSGGMYMPYEEDEDDMVAAGLFGRVSETFNTAKDIAHVIWNVGWRK